MPLFLFRLHTPARLKGAIEYWDAVTSVNSKTGAVTLDATDVGALASNTTYVSSVNGNSGAVTVSDLSISSDGDLDGATYTIVDGNTSYPFPSSERFTTVNAGLLSYIQTLAVNGNLFPTVVSGDKRNLVLDGDDIAYDANTSVNAKIDTIISSGGEPNAINTISVNNVNQTITNKNVNIETVIIGSTSDYTPTQVKSAIDSGKNVIITYTHSTYGNIVGHSFNYSQAYNALVANIVAYYNGDYLLFELVGLLNSNSWQVFVTQLAQSTDIPTNVSDLANDAGYLTSYTETDPTVPSWAKASSKPSYTASEVGALANTGGNVEGDVTLKAAAGQPSPSLIFQRGTLTDNYNDWQIQDRSGYLYFDQRGNGSTSWANQMWIDTAGGVHATTFSGYALNAASAKAVDTTISAGSTSANLPTSQAVASYVDSAVTGLQTTSNLVTSVSSASTDTEYPSAKLLYDITRKSVVQATGSSSTLNLASGTITQIPLTTHTANDETNVAWNDTQKGIEILTEGYYKVQGSVYIKGTTSVTQVGAYIKKATSAGAYSSASELLGCLHATGKVAGDFVVTTPTKLVYFYAHDIVYLAGRSMSAAGTAYPSNAATFLSVEQV